MREQSWQTQISTAQKINRFFSSRRVELIAVTALSVLAVLFNIIFFSVKFTELIYYGISRANMSFWSSGILPIDFNEFAYISNINVYFITAFFVGLALYIAAALVRLLKKSNKVFYAAAGYTVVLNSASLIFGAVLSILRTGAIACSVLSIIFALIFIAFLIANNRAVLVKNGKSAASGETSENAESESEYKQPQKPAHYKAFKLALLIIGCISLLLMFIVLVVPLYSETAGNGHYTQNGTSSASYILFRALSSESSSVYLSVVFLAMFLAFFAGVLYFTATVMAYFKSDAEFITKSKKFVTFAAVYSLMFFILGYAATFYINSVESDNALSATTVSYIPFILQVVALIVYSVFGGMMRTETVSGNGDKRKPFKIEPLIFAVALTVVTFVSLALNVVTIHAEIRTEYIGTELQNVSLNGYQLLTGYGDLEGGFQALAFIEFAFLLSSGILLVLTVIGFAAKDNSYYKLVKIGAIANFLFVLILGLFGIYFKIAQHINKENLLSLLNSYGLNLKDDAYEFTVTSQTIYMLIASFAVVAAMIFRGIFRLGAERGGSEEGGIEKIVIGGQISAPVEHAAAHESMTPADFDACPAFTELDGKRAQFDAELAERERNSFENPTLSDIVRFVVNYARESRLHLSYSHEDIATFVAGLGASRLAILQGMSGTGKTSLPKIFAEALMGNCDIIEVESSWRDKNELLGYYNEFSKCFTPKKFTQSLYKARLNRSVMTFIVLDEMNLSRIEYYFSDFLSLMENEKDKREIKLLNIKLFRTENGLKMPYDGLTDGHTIKVPANVWFVGTANRDESTFEISDKVYDRAQTMNFDKRAPKIHNFGEPLKQRFINCDTLEKLFEAAKQSYKFEAEDNAYVRNTEKLLAPYNISFGNRILKQMEDFVKIYCACFDDRTGVEKDAVERILLSKVVSKLETKVVENKEALAAEFDKLGMELCGRFVRKLNED